ncbi:MAG: hypothetical protein L6Q53_14355 [Candidatus Brocadia sinica]|uniref:Histidine kinase n=1 Tax=Candidatus Brocadia sinica JPN1 TaxID=1197129 RepID=A0ABQ0JYQ5_9BACT|nr:MULTISPECIES: hypothetical protein [Brocadia]MCK6469358.1 hypothetical protein [Candidatus Brocadia sinica]NUO03998.1 hypothetical protein [Candidatus Brocadia sinica]GAN33867.1 putative histidine kinase [Candidatus Brocadia sinica JPN1]GIK14781.1 MAG: hypothetical protein BroJett002_34880 [Candidatus Brocadia sinica]GJQ18152.1 MAG: hypothetical protein HBSIN01_21110 [Candidatus Brocadia sinica]
MYDLTNFTIQDMTQCGDALEHLGYKSKSLEELADSVVRYFYDHLIDRRTSEKSSALVRFFMTYPYESLDEELRQLANKMPGGLSLTKTTSCVVLLATVGAQPDWNSKKLSKGHRVIPLVDKQTVDQHPMIAQLVYQLGIDIDTVLHPRPTLETELESKIFNVFHVPDALGSPHIPAQDEFVIPFGIKSALGFGSMLPTGNLFTVVLFSKTRVPRNTAEMFKYLALNTRIAVLPFVSKKIYVNEKTVLDETERLRSIIATQTSLLSVYKKTAVNQSRRLEGFSLKFTLSLAKFTKKAWLYISLITASSFFLYVFYATHIEFMLHVAAIPLEILLGALLIERLLERKEKAEKFNQLMYIKSYLYRSEMRNLFITNFSSLKFPVITMSKIKNASLEELRHMRDDADHLEYFSLDAMELVIREYVSAYHVFRDFMDRASTYGMDTLFQDMIYILHFIQDVKLFKQENPDTSFIYEVQKHPFLMEKVKKVLGDGTQKFLDYMIELKEKKPELFYDLLTDYELSSRRITR